MKTKKLKRKKAKVAAMRPTVNQSLTWGGKEWGASAARWLKRRFLGRFRRRISATGVELANWPHVIGVVYQAGRTRIVAATLSQSTAPTTLVLGARLPRRLKRVWFMEAA